MKLIPTKEAFEIFSFGLFSIEETAAGIKSSLTNKVEAKAAAGAEKKIEMQKLLDTKEKQEDEKLLEAKPKADKTENFGDKIKKSTGGFFKRLMTVIAALLGGWLLDKLPKIIKAVTSMVKYSIRKRMNPMSRMLRTIIISIFIYVCFCAIANFFLTKRVLFSFFL